MAFARPVRPPWRFGSGGGEQYECWGAARAVRYMDDRRNDRAVDLRVHPEWSITIYGFKCSPGTTVVVLFKILPEGPPTWAKMQVDWQRAFDAYMAVHGHIEARGWDGEEVDLEDARRREATRNPDPTAAGLRREMAMDREEVDSFVASQLEEIRVISVRPYEMRKTGGWVRRDGTAYTCGYQRHKALAAAIVEKHRLDATQDDPEITLELAGWMRIREDLLTHQVQAEIWARPSADQREFWQAFCAEHQVGDAEIEILGTPAEIRQLTEWLAEKSA